MVLTPPAAAPVPPGARLETLDGMRGVAVLMVVLYHVFARWAEPRWVPTLYLHGNALEYLPVLAHFGAVGVLLFFVISGFVITMTLERSAGILDFVGRRVARLWPAMLVCASLSTLVINGSGIAEFYGVERWSVSATEYFWSILFVPPDLGGKLMGLPEPGRLHWVEGVYWTLWHEVRFYALIALTFLLAPRARFLWAWAGVQGASTLLEVTEAVTGRYFPLGTAVNLVLQPRMLAWFSLGLCGYMLWSRRWGPALTLIAALAGVAIVAQEVVTLRGGVPALPPEAPLTAATYLAVLLPFALFLLKSPLLGFMRWRALLAVGLASYPLYLFHERPSMAAMMLTAELGIPPLLGAFLTMAALIGVALAIHRWVEMPAKRAVTRLWRRAFSDLETRLGWLRF